MIANIPVSALYQRYRPVYRHDGAENAGVIVANPETLVSIGNLTSHSVPLGFSDSLLLRFSPSRNIHAAVLVVHHRHDAAWLDDGDAHYNGIVSAPPSVTSVVGHVDWQARSIHRWGYFLLLHAGKPV